jgi:hypothetical protein
MIHGWEFVGQAFQKQAMEHTPVPQTSYESLGAGGHRSAWGTWFEVAKPWSVMNSTFEVCLPLLHMLLNFFRCPHVWQVKLVPCSPVDQFTDIPQTQNPDSLR